MCGREGVQTTTSTFQKGRNMTEAVDDAATGRAEAAQEDGLSQQQGAKEFPFSRSSSTGACTASTPSSTKSAVLSEGSISRALAAQPVAGAEGRVQRRRSQSTEVDPRKDDLKRVLSPFSKDGNVASLNLNTEKQLKNNAFPSVSSEELEMLVGSSVDRVGDRRRGLEVGSVCAPRDARVELLQAAGREIKKARRVQPERPPAHVASVPLASTILADRRCVFFKTQMCPHARRGRCRLDKNCSFAHSEKELRAPPKLDKTKMCVSVKAGVVCSKGPSCSFAHSRDELRHTVTFYKTNMCRNWQAGECPHPDTCNHAHGVHELLFFRTLAAGAGCRDFKKEKEGRRRLLVGDDGVEVAKRRTGQPSECRADILAGAGHNCESGDRVPSGGGGAGGRVEVAAVERAAPRTENRSSQFELVQNLQCHRCGPCEKQVPVSPGAARSRSGVPGSAEGNCSANGKLEDGLSSSVVRQGEMQACSSGRIRIAGRGDDDADAELRATTAQNPAVRRKETPKMAYGTQAVVSRGTAGSAERSAAVGPQIERTACEGKEEDRGRGDSEGELCVGMDGEQQAAFCEAKTYSVEERLDSKRRQLTGSAQHGQAGRSLVAELRRPTRTAEVDGEEIIAALGALFGDRPSVSLHKAAEQVSQLQPRSTSADRAGNGETGEVKHRKDKGENPGARLRQGRRRGAKPKGAPHRRRDKRQEDSADVADRSPLSLLQAKQVGDAGGGVDKERRQWGKVVVQEGGDFNQAIMALVYSLWLRLQQVGQSECDRGTGQQRPAGEVQGEVVPGHSGLPVTASDAALKAHCRDVSPPTSSLRSSMLIALRDAVARAVTCSLQVPPHSDIAQEKSRACVGCDSGDGGTSVGTGSCVDRSQRGQLDKEEKVSTTRSPQLGGPASAARRLLPAAYSNTGGKVSMAHCPEFVAGRRRTVGWPVVPVSPVEQDTELVRRAVTGVHSFELGGVVNVDLRSRRAVTGELPQRNSEESRGSERRTSGGQRERWGGRSREVPALNLLERGFPGATEEGGRECGETDDDFCGFAESILRSESNGSVNSRGGVNSEMTSVSTLPSFSGLCYDASPRSADFGCSYQVDNNAKNSTDITSQLEHSQSGFANAQMTDLLEGEVMDGENAALGALRRSDWCGGRTSESSLRSLVFSRAGRPSDTTQRRYSPPVHGSANGEGEGKKQRAGRETWGGESSASIAPAERTASNRNGDRSISRGAAATESVLWRLSSSQSVGGEQGHIEEKAVQRHELGTQEKGQGRERDAGQPDEQDTLQRAFANGTQQSTPAQLLLTQAVFGPQWRKDLCEVATSAVDPLVLIESMMQALGLEG
ncbi:zinc finger (ccch type) motif-containing protein [Cystoisospora suis]|uniref:Zinc finger (Ccch type) motif-containing protein n=1 Tax=Cystoisospora suis TaxID=483139 RepID=A0A2C6LAP7_9APIC|nr:zinc finger (ccch type) motif-containing protein [Cystoisospora suis]